MQVIYSDQPAKWEGKSVFLAGPTPRSPEVKSWRREALELLTNSNFRHTVLVPERRDWAVKFAYEDQVDWEFAGLEGCTLIVCWLPRNLATMPGFTTNVEFGRYVGSGRILYGRPEEAVNVRYLDWLYHKLTNQQPVHDLSDLLNRCSSILDAS